MTSPAKFLHSHLRTSAEGFAWAIQQVPPERLFIMPPGPLGEWNAVRHLFHIHYYEQSLALPGIDQWWGGAMPVVADEDEETAWQMALEDWEDRDSLATWPPSGPSYLGSPGRQGDPRLVDNLLAEFLSLREKGVSQLRKAPDDLWEKSLETVWGTTSLAWVVSKTYQHTTEHISDVLRIALFWDRFGG